MKRTKKRTLCKIGDLVACYNEVVCHDGTKHNSPVIGWVEQISPTLQYGDVYYIRWSDRLENDLMFVSESQMPPLLKLIEQIRSGDVS